MKIKLLIIFIIEILCISLYKGDVQSEFDAEMDKFWGTIKMQTPGYSAFVTHKDKIYVSSNGYATLGTLNKKSIKKGTSKYLDLLPKNNVLATEDISYMLASVSKTVTFLALAILYDEGKFQLDDDVNDYLDYSIRNPNYKNVPITFRMFFTHSTSIKSWPSFKAIERLYGPKGVWLGYNDFAKGSDFCPQNDGLQSFFNEYFNNKGNSLYGGNNFDFYSKTPYNNFRPGSKENYSNLGASFVGVLVEKISGKSFEQFCQERIFDVIGMPNTSWQFKPEQILNNEIATPYVYSKNMKKFITGGHYCYIDYPNGALFSSAKDLAKYTYTILKHGKVFNSNSRIVSEKVGKEILTCQDKKECDWGLGWVISNNRDNWMKNQLASAPRPLNMKKIVYHDGSEQGVSTNIVLDLNNDLTYGILVNGDEDVGKYGKAIVGAFYKALNKASPEEGDDCKLYSLNPKKCRNTKGCQFKRRRPKKRRCFSSTK